MNRYTWTHTIKLPAISVGQLWVNRDGNTHIKICNLAKGHRYRITFIEANITALASEEDIHKSFRLV